jgi:hypothetical protein
MQLELIAPWYAENKSDSLILDFFDSIPKYPFAVTTVVATPGSLQIPFTLRSRKYTARLTPAWIKDARTGEERLVFAGSREELVERALRFLAVQQIARTQLTPDLETGRQEVTVFFTLSMLRRHLEDLGHGFRLSSIREALDILSGTLLEVRSESGEETGRGWILRIYVGCAAGQRALSYHPLATQAILERAYFPIHQTRVGSLKCPLARWLTTRMSHGSYQARTNDSYRIGLETILEERGLPPTGRLWDSLKSVREALREMCRGRILSERLPFEEKLIRVRRKGRPRIMDARWTLYPACSGQISVKGAQPGVNRR